MKNKFKYKCICMWSKDNKYGFIPNAECPVHGKSAKKMLKESVGFEEEEKKITKGFNKAVSGLGDFGRNKWGRSYCY